MARENPERLVKIPADAIMLEGAIALPRGAQGIVAHGSGSSRHSTRNKYVARTLPESGIGTLPFDLLTREDDTAYENRFDIDLLTERLKAATLWLQDLHRPESFLSAASARAPVLRQLYMRLLISGGSMPSSLVAVVRIWQKRPSDEFNLRPPLIVGRYDDVVIT